jgi:FeS assembly protein IscX
MNHYEPPIEWADHEDIAIALYEKFGDDFSEAKIYRIRFTELLEWILTLPNFNGTREQSTEGQVGVRVARPPIAAPLNPTQAGPYDLAQPAVAGCSLFLSRL